jgi:hypothetical protein
MAEAFTALDTSPGACARYDAERVRGSLAPALTAHLSPTASGTCDRVFESGSRPAREGAAPRA